jgi:hypothetical protein
VECVRDGFPFRNGPLRTLADIEDAGITPQARNPLNSVSAPLDVLGQIGPADRPSAERLAVQRGEASARWSAPTRRELIARRGWVKSLAR